MSNNLKQPKKLELAEPSPKKEVSGGEGASLPVSIELSKKREEYYDNYENRLRGDRVALINDIQLKRKSKVFVYYSHDTLDAQHAEIFFELLQDVGNQEKLDLFLLSPGGFADQAFNMARWCRKYASKEFNVIIPYYAKSAATLLALGADSLVMGPSSELGPIDPQIRIPDEYGRTMQVSALSIKDALRVIEGITEDNQEKALKYMPLIEKIDLKVLGQYDRAIQSAKQYASDLLEVSSLLKDKNTEETDVNNAGKKVPKYKNIAHQLTEGYYSHGYAIGIDKAESLGFNVSCPGKPGFDLAVWKSIWRLHKLYEDIISNSRKEGLLAENLIEYRQTLTIFETDSFSVVPPEKRIIKDLSQSYDKKK
jgi:hypothetical protein